GYVIPRRTPRWPSIGLNSWSCSTRASSVRFSSSALPSLPAASILAISTISSSLWQELVERRIDGADGDGLAVHRLEDAVEVLPLEREELGERRAAVGLGLGQDHA